MLTERQYFILLTQNQLHPDMLKRELDVGWTEQACLLALPSHVMRCASVALFFLSATTMT